MRCVGLGKSRQLTASDPLCTLHASGQRSGRLNPPILSILGSHPPLMWRQNTKARTGNIAYGASGHFLPTHGVSFFWASRNSVQNNGPEHFGGAGGRSVAPGRTSTGVPLLHLQSLLGHNSIETTQISTQLTTTDLKEAHGRFHPRVQQATEVDINQCFMLPPQLQRQLIAQSKCQCYCHSHQGDAPKVRV